MPTTQNCSDIDAANKAVDRSDALYCCLILMERGNAVVFVELWKEARIPRSGYIFASRKSDEYKYKSSMKH